MRAGLQRIQIFDIKKLKKEVKTIQPITISSGSHQAETVFQVSQKTEPSMQYIYTRKNEDHHSLIFCTP